MSGIVFFATQRLREIVEFYARRIHMDVWISQEDCTIMRKGDFALGFCQRDSADTSGVITFVVDTKEDVDRTFEELSDLAKDPPRLNEKYRIYHFFLSDPEGRMLEVQQFLDL